mgnify:CR=1 FL=1
MAIIRIISFVFYFIPDSVAMWIARFAGLFFYRIMKKGRLGLKAKRILPKVFPDRTHKWYSKVLKENAVHLMKFAGEMFKARHKTNFFLKKKCYIASGENYYKSLFDSAEGFMILTCHLGNWEYAAAYLALERKIYAPVFVENSTGNKALNWMREGHNVELIPVGRDPRLSAKALLYMIDLLKRGEILFIVADQAPQGGNFTANFFGKKLRVFGGPYILGIKTVKPLIPMYSIRNGRNKIAINFDKPICFGQIDQNGKNLSKFEPEFKMAFASDSSKPGEDSSSFYSFDRMEDGIQHIMSFFENIISKYPHQYLWSQDRW